MGEKRKWQAASLAVVFVVNILLISLIQGAQAATWRQEEMLYIGYLLHLI